MSEQSISAEAGPGAERQASTWIVTLSTGVIVVRAWSRAAAIKRAVQEEFIRVGGKLLFDRMGMVGKLEVVFEECRRRTWFDVDMGYEVDFDDTKDGRIINPLNFAAKKRKG